MSEISMKGVLRRYHGWGGVGSNYSVKSNLMGGSNGSVRTTLENRARTNHSFSKSECVYGWTAAFEQTWTHILIRIRLNPDSGVTASELAACETRWQNSIRNIWNNKWGCGHSGELSCELTFDVQWVGSGQHHTVRVDDVSVHTNMTHWDENDPGSTAAHEYGHMLGNDDEYSASNCPDRDPVNTGNIMDNNSNNVPARMMQRFANNIGCSVVAI